MSFTFLVTTDNHLGFRQDDFVRRKDSFKAFAEALRIARERDVDFILLGGDLFHVNRPSPMIEHKCIKIIREHMSAKTTGGVRFKRISGEFSHFERVKHGNFEDENLKVSHPILTIHGNHDDPTGPQAKSVCEKLATSGLLNYFGNYKLTSNLVEIRPIIFEKDNIKIALYGLGFIPDAKLRIALERGQVCFIPPPHDTYNVLVVHQNRVPHVKAKLIPDEMFPTFIHLLIRGHEHDAMAPTPWPESKVNGLVYQPGSTVATSICAMEQAFKNVAIMSVKLNNPQGDQATRYKLDYELIPIESARKILLKDVSQKEIFEHIKKNDTRRKLTPLEYQNIFRDYIVKVIEELVKDRSDKPLVKVRCEYKHKVERFDDLEVATKFHPEKIANRDIVKFKKFKALSSANGIQENITFSKDSWSSDEEEREEFDTINLIEERRDTIEHLIENYFVGKPENDNLQALSLSEYIGAVRGAVEDGNVIARVLKRKKQDMMRLYKNQVENDVNKFKTEEEVRDWFLRAFKVSCLPSGDELDENKTAEQEDGAILLY